MGLFSRSEDIEVDPSLEAAVFCDEALEKQLRKVLQKNQGVLAKELANQGPLRMITFADSVDALAVLTRDSILQVRKDRVEKGPFRWHLIADVTLSQIPANGGTYLARISTDSFLEYRPDDYQRMTQLIKIEARTETAIQSVAALIRELRNA